jgi:predicted GTPase
MDNVDKQTRNIIIAGFTGAGMSALANTLTGANDFKVSDGTTTTIKEIEMGEVFSYNDNNYRVIGTAGFGGSKSPEELLEQFQTIRHHVDGVHQFLFLIKNRSFLFEFLTQFDKIESFIPRNLTTIIIADFSDFQDLDKVNADKKELLNNPRFGEILKSFNDIIYIDNPSLDISCNKCLDNQPCERCSGKIEENKEKITASREIVLNHLAKLNKQSK